MNAKDKIKYLEEEVARLTKEAQYLRHAFKETTPITESDISEPAAVYLKTDEHFKIYIIWALGLYPNGVRLLDIRAITTSLPKAQLFSKMMRRDKKAHETWTRIIIEPRVANHLYAESLREFMVAMGKM